MNKIKIYQFICGVFPPILSQTIRNYIFPLSQAQRLKLEFSKTSITGSEFSGNTSDFHSYRFAIHGFFDWRNIIIANRYSKFSEGAIIEIGANVGTETISYCDLLAPNWNVHAFEPLPGNIYLLKKLSQNLSNLVIHPKAISNKNTIVHFQVPPIYESGTGKIIDFNNSESKDNTIKVESLPLDSYLDSFEKVSLISIDTEGHEPFVLEGSKKIIHKFRPGVIIEVSPKLLRKYADSSSDEIFKFFNDNRYLCFAINRTTLKEFNSESSFPNKSQNWLCIPEENHKHLKSIRNDLLLRAIVPWYLLKSLKRPIAK